jgi:hypothetical protein
MIRVSHDSPITYLMIHVLRPSFVTCLQRWQPYRRDCGQPAASPQVRGFAGLHVEVQPELRAGSGAPVQTSRETVRWVILLGHAGIRCDATALGKFEGYCLVLKPIV